MKENKKKKINCKICQRKFPINGFCVHIFRSHGLRTKEYYDKYLKKENEGICKHCGIETDFKGTTRGYREYCSTNGNRCAAKIQAVRKTKQTKLERYGDSNYVNVEKNKKTKLERYGDENYNNREKYVKTMIREYGGKGTLSSPELIKKYEETMVDRYGVKRPAQNKEIWKKIKQTKISVYGSLNNMAKIVETNLKRYGKKYPLQVPEILQKSLNTIKRKYNVVNAFHVNRSNGKQISKPQKLLYEQVKEKFPDAKLEYVLNEINLSVDIYIPSTNKVIELYGDYWHCNHNKYKSNFYNKSLKMTAKEK